MNFPQLFDTSKKVQAIGRITGINEAVRGGEFKTNTTNKAIEQYSVASNTRLDDKIDSVEVAVGEVLYNVGTLISQFMPDEQIMELLGSTELGAWEPLSAPDFRRRFSSIQIVAGTTAKPNSSIKKQEALQISQILGQFASTGPAPVMVALKVLERAFDDVIIKKEDWDLIQQAMEQQLQGQSGDSDPQAVLQQIEQFINGLPPEAKQAIGQAIAAGRPIGEIMDAVAQQTQQPQQ